MLKRLQALLERRLHALQGMPSGQAAARLDPGLAGASLRRQGNKHLAAGELAQAERCFREGMDLNPGDIKCRLCLGYTLREQGRLTEAYAVLQLAGSGVADAPEAYEVHHLQGEIAWQREDAALATLHFQAALRLKPDFTPACRGLVDIHRARGDAKAERAALLECVQRQPECLEYRLWMTELCLREMDHEGVVEQLSAAIHLGATTPDSYVTLGAALCRIGRGVEGERTMAIGVSMDPTLAGARHYELGCYYLKTGQAALGVEQMDQALRLDPDNLAAYSAILMTMSGATDREDGRYRAVAQNFASAVRRGVERETQTGAASEAPQSKVQDQRLRVGFVSGDLLEHPVTFFLLDVIKALDRQRFYLVAYSNNVINHPITKSAQAAFDEWHEIRRQTDAEAARLVRSHRIDVLIDLGGHTGDNRLSLFGWRPAPVQVTWLGYWASTGLPEMDYILSDAISVPEASTEWFSEQVFRLPHTRLCMSEPRTARPVLVAAPPCLRRGHLTFGSFQQVAKMTPQVLAVWARVMQGIPDARLRIQTRGLEVPATRDRVLQSLLGAGIEPARITLLGAVGHDDYLDAHSEVDILLDTFPYPGGTTTALALWMGVPTITMTGHTMISRQGVCMLTCVGLAEWIARDETDYVAIAVRMNARREELERLRSGLRARALASTLFDTRRFAQDFQTALENMVHGQQRAP